MNGGRTLGAAASGLVFGFGLVLSGMTNPRKVVGFLDVFGNWDPSLGLVMAGALAVTLIAFPLVTRRNKPVFDAVLHLPTRTDVDLPLIAGSILFGIGWGIAGYCPGPAIASLGGPIADAAIFVTAMVAGMLGKRLLLDPLFPPSAPAAKTSR